MKQTRTIKIRLDTYRQLKLLAARNDEKLMDLVARLVREERSEDFERAAKALDELITLRYLRDDMMDFHIVDDSLRIIAQARRDNPSYPITVALANYMREHGYIE